jgi:hypothetical protein
MADITKKSLLNRQIYLVGANGDLDTGETFIYDDFNDLNQHLALCSPDLEPDLMVIHGIITPASYLPPNPGRFVYLLVQDPEHAQYGAIYEIECNSVYDLCKKIEEVVTEGCSHYKNISIDDVFVVYGYGMNLGYVVLPEEIEEENLQECIKTSSFMEER